MELQPLLDRAANGDAAAAEQILPLVYDELRRLAAAMLTREKPGQTLQPTALVHEAYLRLVASGGREPPEAAAARPDGEKERRSEGEMGQVSVPSVSPSLPPSVPSYSSRTHFFAAAAEAMRRILVDRARRKAAVKHGGQLARQELIDSDLAATAPPEEVIAVHELLDQLAAEDPLTADLIKLHYFGGFSVEAAGENLGLTRATAYRLYAYGKAWLRDALQGEGP